ncbi:hypothetical protein P3G55_05545 [Leptospira sp. 96542]|nr:hypothetical protein [Leptospira sp. 96542]
MELVIPKNVNPELLPMIRQGLLSPEKLSILTDLYEIVERFAGCLYTDEETQKKIQTKTGCLPDLITWADYFQTEVASRYFLESETSLQKIVDTIRFDLVSANLIFSGKPDYYKDKIRAEALVSKGIDAALWDTEMEESAHLDILLNYFENLELWKKPLSLQDKAWYESFQIDEIAV